MVISWVPPNAHVLQYHVSYTALTGADSQDHTVLVPGGEKQVMLESLQPDARYSILVTAEYHNREGGSGSAQGKTGGYAYLKVSTYRNIKLNSNICQLCIQLEALACCAQALGRDFRPLLTTWLYPVLEKAGEETLLVSQAALSSIWNINKVCGYASLKELINENSDYLLNDISLNLQRLSLHLQAPPVLTVLLTHSDCSLLVGDMVQDLDLSYERTAALFCSALHALMKALARWFPSTCSRTSTSASSRQSSSDQEDLSIRQFLLNYRKQKELAESIGIEDDDTEDRGVSSLRGCVLSFLSLHATDRPMGMIWLDVASLRPFDLVIPFTIQKGEVTGEVRMASGKVAKLDITDNNDGTVADKYAPTEAGLHEMDIKYDGTHIPGSPLQFYMDCMNGAYGPGLIHDPSGDVPRLHAWKHSARNPLLHPSPAAEPQTC
ncbi:unnamed protein product [Oreochromis niloticus]|nr:unnamed protein product [Mustela putorius furo]